MIDKITDEYLDDILVRLAHHSAGIEGNTISLNDTISILIYDNIPGTRSINKREFFEIENHKRAFNSVVDKLRENRDVDVNFIKDIHEDLMDHLDHNRGKFKESSNAILGADFETASPEKTPELMYQWCDNLNYQLSEAKNDKEVIKIVAEKHIEFERIHPFSDGNGRTGRLLLNYSLLKNDLPPCIIEKEAKGEYIQGLNDITGNKLTKFMEECIEKERERLERFCNKENSRLKLIKNDKSKDRSRGR